MDNELLLKNYKNNTNRHRIEMVRLRNLMTRGIISKKEAIDSFQKYLQNEFGRKIYK